MAAGRENPLVSEYFREDHPAVLRLVRVIVGEGAASPSRSAESWRDKSTPYPTLLKLGIRNLSVAPPLVPGVKETAVRQAAL